MRFPLEFSIILILSQTKRRKRWKKINEEGQYSNSIEDDEENKA
jgi:hypothetical protein